MSALKLTSARLRLARRISAILIPLSLFASAVSFAYVPSTTEKSGKPLRWFESTVVMVPDVGGSERRVGDGTELTAIEQSAESWNNAIVSCSSMQVHVAAPQDNLALGYDGKGGKNENAVIFVASNWRRDQPRSISGRADHIELHQRAESCHDGRIVDADIEINDEFFHLATNKTKIAQMCGTPSRTSWDMSSASIIPAWTS